MVNGEGLMVNEKNLSFNGFIGILLIPLLPKEGCPDPACGIKTGWFCNFDGFYFA